MFDAPLSPMGALMIAWDDLVTKQGIPVGWMESYMYATTYIVVDGSPVYRVDWYSSVVRHRREGGPAALRISDFWRLFSGFGGTTHWNGGNDTANHYKLLQGFPENKRIWTQQPK
jgi:hypothetical protein